MAAQDIFANSVTITPVFTPSTSLLDAHVKLETIQSSPILPNSGDFDDFSSWVKCDFCDYRCPKKGSYFTGYKCFNIIISSFEAVNTFIRRILRIFDKK